MSFELPYGTVCNRPHTGVGIIIVNANDKILLGKRKKAPGIGKWSLPGGKIEHGESVADCARREALEETGIVLGEIAETLFTNDIDEEGHHITLYAVSHCNGSIPVNKEPDKCEGWEWFDVEDLPSDVWAPVLKLIAKVKRLIDRM